MSQESVCSQWYTAVCKLICAFAPLGICLQSSKDNTSWKLIWACLSLFPRTAVRRHHVNTIVTALSLMVEVINPGIKTVRSNKRQLPPFAIPLYSFLFSQHNFSWVDLMQKHWCIFFFSFFHGTNFVDTGKIQLASAHPAVTNNMPYYHNYIAVIKQTYHYSTAWVENM